MTDELSPAEKSALQWLHGSIDVPLTREQLNEVMRQVAEKRPVGFHSRPLVCCNDRGLAGLRCTLPEGHDGYHEETVTTKWGPVPWLRG